MARALAAAGVVASAVVVHVSPALADVGDSVSITAARASLGLPPLTRHQGLEDLATRHARAMATARQVMGMDLGRPIDGVLDQPSLVLQVAGTGASVEAIEAAWVASGRDRANVLRDLDLIGKGVHVGDDGRVWMSVLLAKLVPSSTESTVAPRNVKVRTAAPAVVRKGAGAGLRTQRVRRVPARWV